MRASVPSYLLTLARLMEQVQRASFQSAMIMWLALVHRGVQAEAVKGLLTGR